MVTGRGGTGDARSRERTVDRQREPAAQLEAVGSRRGGAGRLPQEADYLKDKLALGVITIYVDAPNREILRGKPEYHDITETSLENDYVYDYLIDNTGTFDELESQLKGILDNILGV